jgi:hypothetical protein
VRAAARFLLGARACGGRRGGAAAAAAEVCDGAPGGGFTFLNRFAPKLR